MLTLKSFASSLLLSLLASWGCGSASDVHCQRFTDATAACMTLSAREAAQAAQGCAQVAHEQPRCVTALMAASACMSQATCPTIMAPDSPCNAEYGAVSTACYGAPGTGIVQDKSAGEPNAPPSAAWQNYVPHGPQTILRDFISLNL